MKQTLFFLRLLTVILMNIGLTARAQQPFEEPPSPTIPYKFQPGDVISADVMNDLFGKIRNATDGFRSSQDLVGSWLCTTLSIRNPAACISTGFVATPGSAFTTTRTQIITFSCQGQSCQFSAPDFLPHTCDTPGSVQNQLYELSGNFMLLANFGIQSIQKLGPGKFVWSNSQSEITTCQKQNLPPAIPSALTANVSGNAVTLNWINNATDQTGFIVARKDTLAGSYSDLGNATATNFSQIVTAGTYWYRVRAINANGSSLGSNEVMVLVR